MLLDFKNRRLLEKKKRIIIQLKEWQKEQQDLETVINLIETAAKERKLLPRQEEELAKLLSKNEDLSVKIYNKNFELKVVNNEISYNDPSKGFR